MTPTIATPRVVEYRFPCFWGAPIVTSEKSLTCANCGKTLAIRRVKRQHWKIAITLTDPTGIQNKNDPQAQNSSLRAARWTVWD